MRVRALDANGDMTWGRGQGNFLVNTPAAVAQCVKTRLGLFKGEFFRDTSEGTDWKAKVLGERTASTRDPEIRARILGTQGVTGITSYASQVNRETRTFSVQAEISTLYGAAKVSADLSL